MPVFTPIIYPVGVSHGQTVLILTQSGGQMSVTMIDDRRL